MKIRNGFISNSSSSSFILFMPKEKLALKDIEDYFGGYTDVLSPFEKDSLTYLIWLNQYQDVSDEWACSRNTLEEKYEDHAYCKATSREKRDQYNCFGYFDDIRCKECPFYVREKREARNDDYYDLIETNCSFDEDLTKTIKKNKDKAVFELSVDDNEPPKFLTFDAAYNIVNVGRDIFKKHEYVVERGHE